MTQIFHSMIAAILGISEKQIGQTLALLDDGATIPFISRYRKEMTGGLDEVQIESIQTHYEKLKETARRKETIIGTIREQGKMTPELQKRIDETWDGTVLEDIYLPYKPKRKTRAEAARQKGRLAKLLLEKPDVLILDEPTNHLDFATMEWHDIRYPQHSFELEVYP